MNMNLHDDVKVNHRELWEEKWKSWRLRICRMEFSPESVVFPINTGVNHPLVTNSRLHLYLISNFLKNAFISCFLRDFPNVCLHLTTNSHAGSECSGKWCAKNVGRVSSDSGHSRVTVSRVRAEANSVFCLHRTMWVVYSGVRIEDLAVGTELYVLSGEDETCLSFIIIVKV